MGNLSDLEWYEQVPVKPYLVTPAHLHLQPSPTPLSAGRYSLGEACNPVAKL